MKRALISIFDKTGITEFADFLTKRGWGLVSTGGTYKHLAQEGLNVQEVSKITNFPEMLDGRVKTLHPKMHAGILAMRDNPKHMATLAEHKIDTLDMVVVNLYPFFDAVRKDISFADKIEMIDIGGPTMLRAAAKNYKDVIVICDVADYKLVMQEMEKSNDVCLKTKQYLAAKVFNLMTAYDAAIASFMGSETLFPKYFNASYKKQMDLRYGENPHQKAAYYCSTVQDGALRDFEQLGGKELSFNNIKDMDVAWKIVCEFSEPACSGIKHCTPCGVAIGENTLSAYTRMHACDSISIFGGIVACNTEVDESTAKEMNKTFLEIVMAPSFSAGAMLVLQEKKNLRIIKMKKTPQGEIEFVSLDGGMLVQETDRINAVDYKTVSKKKPTLEQLKEMEFGMKIVKHVKSNAIVLVDDKTATGIGAGQTNRIWATEQALERAGKRNAVLASDAFFPFRDVVDTAVKAGVGAIVQPGGSMRDQESIDACDERGIAMVFTGIRHFKH